MRADTRYEIEYSKHYASIIVRDVLTGQKVAQTQTVAGATLLRRTVARQAPPTLFIPELDGETVSADAFYEADWAGYQLTESAAEQMIPLTGSGNVF